MTRAFEAALDAYLTQQKQNQQRETEISKAKGFTNGDRIVDSSDSASEMHWLLDNTFLVMMKNDGLEIPRVIRANGVANGVTNGVSNGISDSSMTSVPCVLKGYNMESQTVIVVSVTAISTAIPLSKPPQLLTARTLPISSVVGYTIQSTPVY